VGLLGGQAHIGHAIFAVIRTHDMGISGLTRLMSRGASQCRLRSAPGRPHVHWARNVSVWLCTLLPDVPRSLGRLTGRYVHLGALVRHDVGIRAPFPGT